MSDKNLSKDDLKLLKKLDAQLKGQSKAKAKRKAPSYDELKKYILSSEAIHGAFMRKQGK